MNPDQNTAAGEIGEVLKHYDLGTLVGLDRNDRGYLNTSYAIEVFKGGDQKKYFLRRYKSGIQADEIRFEHGLINHLLRQDFNLVASIFNTKDGETYLSLPAPDMPGQIAYYTIFEFLPGDDKYTWIDPHCSSKEVGNSAALLANYHQAVNGFTPPGQRNDPKIIELIPVLINFLENCIKRSKNSKFDAHLQENLGLFLCNCLQMQQIFSQTTLTELPQLVVHGDFHPGNLKFSGEEIVALFDFDWSKIDLRCFDIGLGIWYFFTSWEAQQDGILRCGEAGQFLDKYQRTAARLTGLEPLNPQELGLLPVMVNLGNLYVLNWLVVDFYAKSVDVDEYLMYLQHNVNFARWFSTSGQSLMLETFTKDPG
ncbi:MAG: phosphotransferase [Anaerolineales bacterium]